VVFAPLSPASSRSGIKTTSQPASRRANLAANSLRGMPSASIPSPSSAAASLAPSASPHVSPCSGSRGIPDHYLPHEAEAFVLERFKRAVEAELKLLVVWCEERTA
jgi:hypothetical protein